MVSRRMKTTPAVTCLKTLLSIFTIIFWLVGIALLAGGIYSKVELSGYARLTTTNVSSAPYVVIGIGVFIVLVGFLGCCAIGKGNTCLLRTYGLALGIIFLAEIVLAFVVIFLRTKISDGFHDGMTIAMTNYKTGDDYKAAVDNAQTTLKCCGSTNYTDYWLTSEWEENTVPSSCCKTVECTSMANHDVVTLPTVNATSYIYTDGCPAKVFGIVNKNLAIVLGSMFGVAGFQMIGLILACCLASTINANKYELV